MEVHVANIFKLNTEQFWEKLRRSDTLTFVAQGFVTFVDQDKFPEYWQVDHPVTTKLRLFGFIPNGSYTIKFTEIDSSQLIMKTTESGGMIKLWEHTMSVSQVEDDRVMYTDSIKIDAGAMTWLVYLYASVYYRYRHRRWRLLIRKSKN